MAYRAGEMMKQSDLALTLESIAHGGSDAFYKGEVAKQITEDLQRHGGVLTYQDFVEHSADWVEPITVHYKGYQVYNIPPNSQGFASLSFLNILNHFDFR